MSTRVGTQSREANISLLDRAGLDDAWPADHHRGAHAALPGGQLAALERGGAAVREGFGLGAVVGGEDDDGVVGLAHLLDLLQNEADVVVHLLHAGFVDAPVLAAGLTHHGQVLVRQHGGDVHARRVVPDEERLVGPARIVAVEEVDDLRRNLLVDCLSTAPGSADPRPCMSCSWSCRRICTRAPGRGGVRQIVVLASTAPGTSGTPGIGVFLHGGATVCCVGVLLMSGKLTPLHRIQVI